MVHEFVKNLTICVVGLGYVGFPLARSFSKHLRTMGYDISSGRIESLKSDDSHNIVLSNNPQIIQNADIVIIAVPTPVTRSKDPDLSFVESAAITVGQNFKKGAIIVLESTVYPGLTEEFVIPVLENASGYVCGEEFKVGYSPERINPGDNEHTIENIYKVVSAIDSDSLKILTDLYGLITNVYCAPNIKTAEAAKVIENIQRDINIALMNELSLIFQKMNIDTHDVLNAAATKWNFLRFSPGLVGGHCIPVDPYYLVFKAKEVGYHPQVILAGRAINDFMPIHVAHLVIKGLNKSGKAIKNSRVLIMGLTYKENVSDTRESPSKNIIKELKDYEVDLFGYDPHLSETELKQFGIKPYDKSDKFDAVVVTVAHDEWKNMTKAAIHELFLDHPIIVDIRGIFRDLSVSGYYVTL